MTRPNPRASLAELKNTVDHLYAKVDAQSYKIGKLSDSQDKANELLQEYNTELAVHIAGVRAAEELILEVRKQNEAQINELKEAFRSIPTRILQMVSIAGGLVVLIKAVFPKI